MSRFHVASTGSQTSSDEVLVECSSLPPPLRNDLQAFLERQPELRAVTPKLRVSDALLDPDTVGLVAPRFDLVVHLCGVSSGQHCGGSRRQGRTDPQEGR